MENDRKGAGGLHTLRILHFQLSIRAKRVTPRIFYRYFAGIAISVSFVLPMLLPPDWDTPPLV
jgi:hypothetical protein